MGKIFPFELNTKKTIKNIFISLTNKKLNTKLCETKPGFGEKQKDEKPRSLQRIPQADRD